MKKVLLFLTVLITVFTLAGCSKKESNVSKDREGTDFVMPGNVERIISTVPSNTEVLVELGVADKIVAVDIFSPIDNLNDDIVQLDFYNLDAEAIINLNPDIIIASGHNKVGQDDDPFKIIKETGITVVYLPSSYSIEDIYLDIEFLASITGKNIKGKEIINSMKASIAEIADIANTIELKDRLTVYMEIGDYGTGGLYSFGEETFLDEIISLVGGKNIYGHEYSWINASAESTIHLNPQVIITNDAYQADPIENIKNRTGFYAIDAVQNDRVYYVDPDASSRPSHNVIKAIKEIAEAIYPNKYDFE